MTEAQKQAILDLLDLERAIQRSGRVSKKAAREERKLVNTLAQDDADFRKRLEEELEMQSE